MILNKSFDKWNSTNTKTKILICSCRRYRLCITFVQLLQGRSVSCRKKCIISGIARMRGVGWGSPTPLKKCIFGQWNGRSLFLPKCQQLLPPKLSESIRVLADKHKHKQTRDCVGHFFLQMGSNTVNLKDYFDPQMNP